MTSPRPRPFASCTILAALTVACGGDKGDDTLDQDADGYETALDCDDTDDQVYPGASEICGNGIDEDCDGVDPPCVLDQDADGFAAADDCDDFDASVNPDAVEDCTNDVDDDCNGISTKCLDPTLVYAPTAPGAYDSYGANVYADMVVFGDLGAGASGFDGRAVFFDVEPGTVDETDARLVSEGEVGGEGAYGIIIDRIGDDLCINAGYHSEGAAAAVGKSWCFEDATVRAATATLPLSSAAYTARGEVTEDFATPVARADFDGDGMEDLAVQTAHGVHVVLGDGTPWAGDYVVPSDASLTLGSCSGSSSHWCGYAHAFNAYPPATFASAGEGGISSISLYDVPLPGGLPATKAVASAARSQEDSAAAIVSLPGFAFGNSPDNEVTFIDSSGAVVGTLAGPANGFTFGYWPATTFDQDGDELLLVSDPWVQTVDGSMGLVYVFNLSANGLPSSADEAEWILRPPPGGIICGLRTGAGIVTNDDGSYTTVASSCSGSGGAAYTLDFRPPPPPSVGPLAITKMSPGNFRIRQWVVDAFTSNEHWLMSLAQTELVQNPQGATVGWRLHGIEPDSPLHRAGLRSGDLVRRVNDTWLTSPEVVMTLYTALKDADALSLRIVRNGTSGTIHYQIVP